MEISKLCRADVERHQSTIKELLRICFRSTYETDVKSEILDEKYEGLISYVESGKAFIFGAVDGDSLIGFLWGYPVKTLFEPVFHIAYIAVNEHRRKSGIGKLLLATAEQQARELGLGRMELIVGVSNGRAVEFYQNLGYVAVRNIMCKAI